MVTTISRLLLLFCAVAFVSVPVALAENWNVDLIDFYNPVNTWAYKVNVYGNYAYVAYKKGLRVINVSTPSALDKDRVGFCLTNPEEIGRSHQAIDVAEDYAYIADDDYGLRIIDVTDSDYPEEVRLGEEFYEITEAARDVRIVNGRAYLACGAGLCIIDVTNPADARVVAIHNTAEEGQGVYIFRDYAYVATGNGGLRVINISNPEAPWEEGFYDAPDLTANGVFVSGDYAYVIDDTSGLAIVDVSYPRDPLQVGFLEIPGEPQDIYVDSDGEYAFVASGSDGLRVIDVSVPKSPQEVGFYDTPGTAQGLDVVGDYVYMADGEGGLRILKCRLMHDVSPESDFSADPIVGGQPLTVNFTDLSPDHMIEWSWDFGDGGTSDLRNPSHEYAEPGDYTVILTATNPVGSVIETKVNYISIFLLPKADFSADAIVGEPSFKVSFTDLSENMPTEWLWDFGDGGSSVLQNPTHTYIRSGFYTVNLTISNPGGSDTELKVDYIHVNQGPSLQITSEYEEWEGGVLIIEAAATDTDGIVEQVVFSYSLDGITWDTIGADETSPYSVDWDTRPVMETVGYNVLVKAAATDNNGSVKEDLAKRRFNVDNEPPITSDNYYEDKWHNKDVTITIAGDDGSKSGVASINYRINGGEVKSVSADGYPRIITDGDSNKLEYWGVDNVGNEEAHHTLTNVRLDTESPISDISLFGDEVTGGYRGPVKATLSATDDLSGVAHIRYRVDSDVWQDYSSSFTIDSDGNHAIQCYSLDNAGNESDEESVSIRIDRFGPSAPEISSTTHTESAWSSDKNVQLSWMEPTDTSGISGYSYTFDENSATVPDETIDAAENSMSYKDVSDADGWYFHVRARENSDRWGDTGHFGPIKIDSAPPEIDISSSTHQEEQWNNSNSPIFSWAEPEDASGISGYSYVLDEKPDTVPDNIPEAVSLSIDYTDVADGEWYFQIRARDNTGNWGKTDHYGKIMMDTEIPTFSQWVDEPELLTEYFQGSLTVKVQIADGLSGLSGAPQLIYRIDDDLFGPSDMSESEDSWAYGIDADWSGPAEGTVYYRVTATDGVGNVAESEERSVLIERAPQIEIVTQLSGWVNGEKKLEVVVNDLDGNLKKVTYMYSLDNTEWLEIGAAIQSPYDIQWDTSDIIFAGTVWIRATAEDETDLTREVITESFKVDNEPPITQHDYDGEWHEPPITITLTSEDGLGIGVGETWYRLNGGDEQSGSLVELETEGVYGLEYWSIDTLGNEEIPHKTLSVKTMLGNTMLHQNYPNPFKRETWVPFQLATESDVTLTIYSCNGRIVWHTDLGTTPQGFYLTRDKAICWDGFSQDGLPAAVGLYFYHLQAGDYAAIRRMALLR